MSEKTCKKCGHEFRDMFTLRRHMSNKKSCASIIEQTDLSNEDQCKQFRCRYCGRSFTIISSMNRHVKQYCKIANSDEGMEKLIDYTLQKQLFDQNREITEMKLQVTELTSLLKGQLSINLITQNTQIVNKDNKINKINKINNGSETNNIIQNITINPWTPLGAQPFCIPSSMLIAVFTENPRLVEYSHRSDMDDAETAAPYVLEALLEFVKRLHADPIARNAYLNPKRADQVLVFVEEAGGCWKIITLVEAIRSLFDGVTGGIIKTICKPQTLRELPANVQCAASFVPMLYSDQDDKYIIDAKSPLSAHLTNTTPKDNSKFILIPPDALFDVASEKILINIPKIHIPAKDFHLSQTDIIRIMQSSPAEEPGVVSESYIKLLITNSGVESSYFIKKLWEATEDRILSTSDDCTAKAVVTEYDSNKLKYE